MKLLPTLIINTLLVGCIYAQNADFVVEVGAFAEPVSIHYFDKLEHVYEVVGINDIYRYRIDAQDLTTATSLQKKAIDKGYIHSRIIDVKTIKDQCSIECGYTPPTPTGRGTIGLENANMYELKNQPKNNNEEDKNGTIGLENANMYELKNQPKNNNEEDKNGTIGLENANMYELKNQPKNNNNEDKNGNINLENANTYELKSKNGEIDIVDISKFEFKKGDKVECLFFDYDSHLLRDKSKTELNKLAWFLGKNKNHILNICSYTDAKGGDSYNLNLAKKRATTTKKYLTQLGVSSSQIIIEVYGEQKPIAINETVEGHDCEEGRQYNRRIELTVLDNNKKPIDIVKHIYVPETLRPNTKD